MAELTEEEYNEVERELGDPVLTKSLYGAARKNPDQSAKIVQLSDSQFLPTDTVERNTAEVEARDLYGDLDPIEIQKNNPDTAEYLSDPKNASVSIDDIDNLRGLEDALRDDSDLLDAFEQSGRGFMATLNELVGNVIQLYGTLEENFTELSPINPSLVRDAEGKLRFEWGMRGSLDETHSGIGNVGEFISEDPMFRAGYKPAPTWENFKGDLTVSNAAEHIIQSAGPSVAHMVAILYSLPVYVASRTEEIAETFVENDQRQDVELTDLSRGFVTAVVVSLFEKIGAKAVFDLGATKGIKQVAVNTLEAILKEAGTETVQEGAEYIGETLGSKKDFNILEMLDRQLSAAFAGGGIGGGIRGTTASLQALGSRAEKNATRAARSMNDQLELDNIVTFAQASKTRERAQDRFESFLRATGKDRVVYISAQQVLLLEDSGVDLPKYMTDEAFGDGDVEIPMDRFAADIAPNEELMEVLRPHLRLSSDTLTADEMAAGGDTTIRQLMEKANASDDLKSETDTIWETVKDQIVATGRQGEETARLSASLISSYAAARI